ncbi:EmrB/QacA subfamily drug resistance transporter [Friedmanniella endophytica]|uniref:EmrB/QacA subfamily drug resistance transporter n=1 Tax=Microlunatus kandeliicorticis TaxID=1759536 RepID=A0A7W3ITU5_9ACTN|nr:MFS transporter [Microlunatus kandeliicorticis]MBA8795095.1 EmrB/QacA subfamily drug resistance transporter [Microlunatus kandeliicorticis]
MTTATVTRTESAAAPAPQRQLSHKEILEVMTGLLAGLFTALLSSTIVSTALPTIMADLHGTQRQYTWVITASLLAMTISTPIWGKLSDLFNKKLLIQISIVMFVAGSVGAGLSQSVPPMMAFRALQGLAMGGLTALTQSIIGSIIPPRERGRYSGYMGAVMAVSTVSGPLLGGVITQHIDWRWCFFVCVPLAVISLIVLQKTLRLPTVRRKVHFDYLGAILIAIAAALPMLWVTFAGQDYDWISWQSGLFLLGFLAAAGLAVLVELKARHPMVPIRVMSNSTTALMIVASLGVGVTMFGSGTFLTQYFQLAGGNSPTRAGLMTIPLIIAQMLSSTIGGQIVSRTGRWKPIMVFGSVLLLAGLGGMATIDHGTPYWQVAIFMAVMGVGVGTLVQNIVLAVQNTVDVKDIGSSSAIISFFRSLGGAVGVTVLGAVLADRVESKITGALGPQASAGAGAGTLDIKDLPAAVQTVIHTAYGDSFGLLFGIAGAIAILTLVTVIAVREVPLRTTIELKPSAGTDAQQPVSGATEAAGAVPTATLQPSRVETADGPSAELESVDGFDRDALDDPAERQAVAAMDVLRAAQEQARQQLVAARDSHADVAERIEQVGRDADAALARFHAELDQIQARLRAETPEGAPVIQDGSGGTDLRRYEYGLLLSSQQTADRLNRIARLEAERILADAEQQRADLEHRIELLRRTEAELSEKVKARLEA